MPRLAAPSTLAVAVAAALASAGCSDSTGPSCTEETRTQDVMFGSIHEEVQQRIVDRYREEGWTCESEPIRNAFGNRVGLEYTCTICR